MLHIEYHGSESQNKLLGSETQHALIFANSTAIVWKHTSATAPLQLVNCKLIAHTIDIRGIFLLVSSADLD